MGTALHAAESGQGPEGLSPAAPPTAHRGHSDLPCALHWRCRWGAESQLLSLFSILKLQASPKASGTPPNSLSLSSEPRDEPLGPEELTTEGACCFLAMDRTLRMRMFSRGRHLDGSLPTHDAPAPHQPCPPVVRWWLQRQDQPRTVGLQPHALSTMPACPPF